MTKFIEVTQHVERIFDDLIIDRKVKVNIERIEFYYDKRIVLTNQKIDVHESYDEITKLLEEQQ